MICEIDYSKSTIANLVLLSIFLIFAVFLKIYYIYADNSSLRWILFPTTIIVSLFSGIHFYFIDNVGYTSFNGFYVINKTCAGLNFLIIIFTLSIVLIFRIREKVINNLFIFLTLLLSCFVLTIIANSSRIYSSIFIEMIKHQLPFLKSSKNWFHEAMGIVIFFSYLLLYYFIIKRVKKWMEQKK